MFAARLIKRERHKEKGDWGMSKDFSDCKKEVLEVLFSCFFYLTAEKLSRELMYVDTKNEDELLQSIKDTVRLFAPELVEEANDEPEML